MAHSGLAFQCALRHNPCLEDQSPGKSRDKDNGTAQSAGLRQPEAETQLRVIVMDPAWHRFVPRVGLLVARAAQAVGIAAPSGVSVVLADDRLVRGLNARHRGKNKAHQCADLRTSGARNWFWPLASSGGRRRRPVGAWRIIWRT